MSSAVFITGIDTDCGKTIATGLMAQYIAKKGVSVITQKFVQTGCIDTSDDILMHRKLMNIPLTDDDHYGITCSYLFEVPASPHLAAQQKGQTIDPKRFKAATLELQKKYKTVLMEGAGGLMVPLNDHTIMLDYIVEQQYPVILVTYAKLGSINHTLLNLEVLKSKGLNLLGLVYNQFPNNSPLICLDTEYVLSQQLKSYFPNAYFWTIPNIKLENSPEVEFDGLIEAITD
jgi:dethiobiotin synthetase